MRTPVIVGTVHMAAGVGVGVPPTVGVGLGVADGANVGVGVGTAVGDGLAVGVGVAWTVFETVIVWLAQLATVPAGTLCHAVFCPFGPILVRFPAWNPAFVDHTVAASPSFVGPNVKSGTVHVPAGRLGSGDAEGNVTSPPTRSKEVRTTADASDVNVMDDPTICEMSGVTSVKGTCART